MPKTVRRPAGMKGVTPSQGTSHGKATGKVPIKRFASGSIANKTTVIHSKREIFDGSVIATDIQDPAAKPIEGKGNDWQETTLSEMLSLPDWDMRIIDLRLGLIRAIRQIRKDAGLTQVELAMRLGVSQPRVAMLESVEKEPTLDALMPAYFAAGGTSAQLCEIVRKTDESSSY